MRQQRFGRRRRGGLRGGVDERRVGRERTRARDGRQTPRAGDARAVLDGGVGDESRNHGVDEFRIANRRDGDGGGVRRRLRRRRRIGDAARADAVRGGGGRGDGGVEHGGGEVRGGGGGGGATPGRLSSVGTERGDGGDGMPRRRRVARRLRREERARAPTRHCARGRWMERPRERRRRRARAWSPPAAASSRCDTPPPRFPRGAPTVSRRRLFSARRGVAPRGVGPRRGDNGVRARRAEREDAAEERRRLAVAASCVVAAENRASDVIAVDAGDAHRSVASATRRRRTRDRSILLTPRILLAGRFAAAALARRQDARRAARAFHLESLREHGANLRVVDVRRRARHRGKRATGTRWKRSARGRVTGGTTSARSNPGDARVRSAIRRSGKKTGRDGWRC